MKEDNMVGGVGVTAFDYPNGQHPGYENKIYYGNQNVPRPTNEAAKKVNGAEVLAETMYARK